MASSLRRTSSNGRARQDFSMSGLNKVVVAIMFGYERQEGASLLFDNEFIIDYVNPSKWVQQPNIFAGDEFSLNFGGQTVTILGCWASSRLWKSVNRQQLSGEDLLAMRSKHEELLDVMAAHFC
ncbi:hypothetical protein PG984_011326 [Apiospora sp. TS-2023a]